jgi:hypothetical protein
MVKKVYKWTPMSTRSLGRRKNGWEYDVRNMRITSWKDWIGNRPKWNEVVENAKTYLKLQRLKKKKKKCY